MFPNIIDIILIARCQRDLAEHESEPYSELSTQFRHRGMLPVPTEPPRDLSGARCQVGAAPEAIPPEPCERPGAACFYNTRGTIHGIQQSHQTQ